MTTPRDIAPRRIRLHYSAVIIILCTITNMAAIGFARFSYSLILPAMKDNLGLSYTETGLLASGNFAGYLVASLVAGALAARYSARLVTTLSLLLTGLTMVATGASGGFLPALAGRSLTGVGSGGANIPALGIISSWFAPRRRGLATGIVIGGSGLGMMVAGWVVPILLADGSIGWRNCWYVLGVVAVAISIAVGLLIRNTPEEKGLRAIGTEPIARGVGTPARPAAGSGLREVYRSRALWRLGLVYGTWGFSYIIYATFFAAYLVDERAFDAQYVGWLWSMVGVLATVAGLTWGWVSDGLGRQKTIIALLALQTLSFGLFIVQGGIEWVQLSAVIFGFTGWGVPGVMAATAGDYVGSRMAPASLGFITLLFGIGQAIGPGVAGYVADATGSFAGAFLLATAFGALGVAIATALRPPVAQC